VGLSVLQERIALTIVAAVFAFACWRMARVSVYGALSRYYLKRERVTVAYQFHLKQQRALGRVGASPQASRSGAGCH
jgi:hypothetical protein